jgi:prepilin-type N-terminal cleavage/methylation domain-containing protein
MTGPQGRHFPRKRRSTTVQKTAKKAQKGFTLIELLIVIAVIAILAAIAIPNLLSSRKAANESSAISSVRTLVTAEETYRSRYGSYGDLSDLTTKKLVDSTLADTTNGKSGFKFTATKDTTSPMSKYAITADPVTAGTTGDRSFKADETGVIQAAPNESGTAGSFVTIQ